jgi:hypothetical protein
MSVRTASSASERDGRSVAICARVLGFVLTVSLMATTFPIVPSPTFAANADVHDIKVIFIDEPDTVINLLGIKGVGEIGLVGVATAIANALYHATGKRVRDLPITLDRLQR